MKTFLATAILLFSSVGFSETAKCRIADASAGLAFARGGTVLIDVPTGNIVIHDTNGETHDLISRLRVSTFGALRTACYEGSDSVYRTDGTLRFKNFWMRHCAHRDGDGRAGYVRVGFGVDMNSKAGAYSELFMLPRGVSPSERMAFNSCEIHE